MCGLGADGRQVQELRGFEVVDGGEEGVESFFGGENCGISCCEWRKGRERLRSIWKEAKKENGGRTDYHALPP